MQKRSRKCLKNSLIHDNNFSDQLEVKLIKSFRRDNFLSFSHGLSIYNQLVKTFWNIFPNSNLILHFS